MLLLTIDRRFML